MPLFKGKNIRRDQGVLHKPDDVSRVDQKSQFVKPTNTIDGQIVAPVDPEDYYALNTARRVREFRQTMTNSAIAIDFDSICIGLEVVVDSQTPATSLGVAFGADSASIPVDSDVLASSSEVKSGEARYYDVHVNRVSLRTVGTGVVVRMTVFLP